MVDVTDCDREPIHIPGTIQPFGALFVLAEPSLTVTQVSENVGDHLPFRVEEVLGRPLSTMMDPASVALVREALGEERWQDMNPLQIGVDGRQFDGIVTRERPFSSSSRIPVQPSGRTTRFGRRSCGFNAWSRPPNSRTSSFSKCGA
jgi:light-regulated signal transduction histidine kinase (bacteriophytochrome)